ncbi:MAG TPA: GNAT family N-acetyltransferase [Anaeromyxobacter sp.]|nr:GNAT family N-acetyltransferase [Anaeromyxobacter sp.]
MAAIEVKPLSPPLAEDYLALFDTAFEDNRDWSGCYCLYYHSADEAWEAGPESAAAHRAERAAQLARGEAPGYLAYLEGRPVGWLNAGPREAYQNLRGLPGGGPGEAMVMCFLVLPGARGRGVAGALLDFALQDLKRRGLRAVEAYPPTHAAPPGGLSWEAASYKGPLSLYLVRGFKLEERGGRRVARRAL